MDMDVDSVRREYPVSQRYPRNRKKYRKLLGNYAVLVNSSTPNETR
jgi:hypothetical protein